MVLLAAASGICQEWWLPASVCHTNCKETSINRFNKQVIMKKQFSIKPAQVIKAISKSESANILKFLADGPRCCSEWDLSKMVATR